QRRGFAETVRRLLAGEPAEQVARDFSARLAAAWPRKAIGFTLAADGKLLSPSAQAARKNDDWQRFLLGNGGFLSGSIPAQVYWVSADELNRPDVLRAKSKAAYDNKLAIEQTAVQQKALAPGKDEGALNRQKELRLESNAPAAPAATAA